jgi:hypothetical protein
VGAGDGVRAGAGVDGPGLTAGWIAVLGAGRTSSSLMADRASMRFMILPRPQSASRVSRIAPSISKMMTSRSPRAQVLKSDNGAIAPVKAASDLPVR